MGCIPPFPKDYHIFRGFSRCFFVDRGIFLLRLSESRLASMDRALLRWQGSSLGLGRKRGRKEY